MGGLFYWEAILSVMQDMLLLQMGMIPMIISILIGVGLVGIMAISGFLYSVGMTPV